MLRIHSLTLALALLVCSLGVSNADDDPGHFCHGTAFDSGLRQRPWKMEGIGQELELHSTILIDTKGRVEWKRTGGKLFADVEFLLQSVKRMNQQALAQPIADAQEK